ncbi:hypothetical protein E8E11_008383 [Didymella keratinophila]|nr:hypothetical protein E8E11_008383 [Didymella keratinophila]
MTLLVARQCRLLGAARSLRRLPAAVTTRAFAHEASTPLPFRIRRIGGNAASSARVEARVKGRGDSSTAWDRRPPQEHSLLVTPKLQDCEIGSVTSAILTPEHFVEKIESLHADTVNGNDLVVFLATPSFASWLLNDSVFLAKALAKLYKNIASSASLQAVCAVVDRLPQARPARGENNDNAINAETVYRTDGADDENPIKAAMVERAVHPPVNETGVEGITYVVLPQKAALSAQPAVSGEQGCIDFLAHTKTTELGRDHDRVRVPLANTVFQTGAPSTLISSWWSLSTGGKLEFQSREQRKTMSIDLSAQRLDPASQTKSPRHHDVATLSIPLIPLTFPREVNGHMGNIIRGLKDANGNAMTASTELEQVVPHYFAARGETPRATSAWAVVSKKKTARSLVNEVVEGLLERGDTNADRQLGLEQLWAADPPRWDQRVQRSFTRDGRLHKVLSGGGGWGKKAGLLSLDPMPIGAPQLERAAEMDGDYETVDEFSTALKPVVKDGHWIRFYISPTVAQDHDEDVGVHGFLDQGTSSDTSARQPWSWEFGVIPSTIDSIPSDSPQRSLEAHGEITVHKGTFGALTEGGLTLMRGSDLDEKSGIARRELNATTIDVPFARWSAMRLVPKEGVELRTIEELAALKRKPAEKPRVVKGRSNVSVRDFSTSTFATPERPTAAPLLSTIQTPQWPRAFSSTCTAGARRAWLPYQQHKQRKLNNVGIPSTEQDGPAQNTPATETTPQASPEKVKAILANLKIPVWKRATITKVRHHFDDVKWAGQKDRDLLVRRTKTGTLAPASGSPEPQSKRSPARKMVLYRPGGIEPKSKSEMPKDPKLGPSQDPLPFSATHGSLEPNSENHVTRSAGSQRSRDRRTISMTPKRPDTIVNEWDFDTITRGQSERSFSTTHKLTIGQARQSHRRRSKKRRRERAEQEVAASPGPLIRKIMFEEKDSRGNDSRGEPEPATQRVEQPAISQRKRTIQIRKLYDAQTPFIRKRFDNTTAGRASHSRTWKASTAENKSRKPEVTKTKSMMTTTMKHNFTETDKRLPRLLRQARGEVPPRTPVERANGEAERDFNKLEQFLWTGYQRVVSSVRKCTREVGRDVLKRNGSPTAHPKPARRKAKGKRDGVVRKIPILVPASADTLVQHFFTRMQTAGQRIAILTDQVEDITALKGSQLQTWTGRSAPISSEKPRLARVRIVVPRRRRQSGKLPHRNPRGLEFVMRSFPLSLSTPGDHISTTAPSSPTPSPSPPPTSPDPASLNVIPFRPLFTRALLADLARHRPELLRRHFLPALYQQAERMIKRSQLLAATARAMVPGAPVLVGSHGTRIVPRSRNSRRPTIAPAAHKTGAEHKSTGKKSAPHHVRRPRRSERRALSQQPRAQKPRARKVPLGGWKHLYKYFSRQGRGRARIRKFADGELAIKKVAKKSRRQALADDVQGWLTGGGPL